MVLGSGNIIFRGVHSIIFLENRLSPLTNWFFSHNAEMFWHSNWNQVNCFGARPLTFAHELGLLCQGTQL